MKQLFLIALCWLLVPAAQAQLNKEKRWKVGMNRFNSSMTYSYKTQGSATEGGDVTEDISKSSSGGISTTDFMVERVFHSRLGLEFNFNLTPGIRNFTFIDSNQTKIGDIVEQTGSSVLYGLNLYFSDHTTGGIKFFMGVLTGNFTSTHTFSNGGDRDDDEEDVLTEYRSSQRSSNTLSAQIMKFGMDWIFDTVGLRIQVFSIEGETKTASALPKTGLGEKQEETLTMGGGLGVGIYGHF